MLRLHQRWPCKAKSIMRPSINQYSCATVALKGGGCGGGGRSVEGLRAWDIGIELAVEGHDAFDGAHGQIRLATQAPDPKAPGIGMALLQMVDLQHHGEPHLARWSMRRRALVREAGRIVVFETR